MSFQVITFADKPPTQPYYLWSQLNASLDRCGVKPLVLGWGSPWTGLGSKPKMLKAAIQSGQIAAKTILVCDGFDVLFADHPEAIADYFHALKDTSILWNAEKNCFPDASLAEQHDPCDTPYRYLNSGLSIGFTERYLSALIDMKVDDEPDSYVREDGSWYHANDQDWMMRQYLAHKHDMKLDTRCEVFQTFHNVSPEEIDLAGPKLRNVLTDTCPIGLHLNGAKEPWKDPILNFLKL